MSEQERFIEWWDAQKIISTDASSISPIVWKMVAWNAWLARSELPSDAETSSERHHQMNRIIPPEQFAREVREAMEKAEDEAGVPRGSIVEAFIEEFNSQFDVPPATSEGSGK